MEVMSKEVLRTGGVSMTTFAPSHSGREVARLEKAKKNAEEDDHHHHCHGEEDGKQKTKGEKGDAAAIAAH